jgi:hypothetical protein
MYAVRHQVAETLEVLNANLELDRYRSLLHPDFSNGRGRHGLGDDEGIRVQPGRKQTEETNGKGR